jgi:hypothetical protein
VHTCAIYSDLQSREPRPKNFERIVLAEDVRPPQFMPTNKHEEEEYDRFIQFMERLNSSNKPALKFPSSSLISEDSSEEEETYLSKRYIGSHEVNNAGQYELVEAFKNFMSRPKSSRYLSKGTIRKILQENPEPQGGVCKVPLPNEEVRAKISKEANQEDKELFKIEREFSNAMRPILSITQALSEECNIPEEAKTLLNQKLMDAIALQQHAIEHFNIYRRKKIAATSHWGRSVQESLHTSQNTAETSLFTEDFQDKLKTYEQEKFQRAILQGLRQPQQGSSERYPTRNQRSVPFNFRGTKPHYQQNSNRYFQTPERNQKSQPRTQHKPQTERVFEPSN